MAVRGGEWNVWSESTLKSRGNLTGDKSSVEARRLENAVWRLWNMDRKEGEENKSSVLSRLNSSASLGGGSGVGSEVDDKKDNSELVGLLQSALGKRVDFANASFPAAKDCRYDDLPTFPIRPNFASFDNALQPASECVVFDGCPEDPYHPSNTPIYQTSTFVQPSCNEFGAYDYTRSGNPTRTALEKHAAMLEKAAAAFAFASGMAALHTVMRLLKNGDEIIVNEDIYGGMHRLLTQDCVHNGVTVVFADTTDISSVAKRITSKTRMIHTESPSNPMMRITDLRKLTELAHRHNVLVCVDSTMMPPVMCKPLTLGVDIVVHSATKFFSGHADCTGGFVCVRNPELAHRVAFLQNAEGTALAPFECFLFLRGIKTMHLRVMKAQENASHVCKFLQAHPAVKGIFFPGQGGCDARSLAIHNTQANGQGSMISLTTGSVKFSQRFCDACQIFKTTVSFGSVNSLCEMPCTMSHASIPDEKRTLPADLVRLSIGIEDAGDLIHDLGRALALARKPVISRDVSVYDSKFEDLPVLPKPPPAVIFECEASTLAPSSTELTSALHTASSCPELSDASQEGEVTPPMALSFTGTKASLFPNAVKATNSANSTDTVANDHVSKERRNLRLQAMALAVGWVSLGLATFLQARRSLRDR
eukprot:TRINITY_DN45624_c0_g1_i1.p1 TRINITY_DN45624_c0_g1~~TRINITY_DN45624_c0_g1_i1.p1  ORF type:complete len:649 (-),score=120.82 TRINITY_DN45624_c0_g1_i1:89-2035(-)